MKTLTKATYTIKQKESGTGTIHDLASEHFDRVIEFNEGEKFAVLTPAYYGASYSCWNPNLEFQEMCNEYKSHDANVVIDRHGNQYVLIYGELIPA